MTDRERPTVERVCRAIVALAARLVPEPRRGPWREEWNAEVWHHLHGNGNGNGIRRATGGPRVVARCLGAFPHALWIRGEEWSVDTVVQDLRYAVRTLLARPGFTFVAVATLALGIGANTAIFSVVNAVLLRPLPMPNADRLVWIWGREYDGRPVASVSPPDFGDYVTGTGGAFEELAAFSSFPTTVAFESGERPEELVGRRVTANFLDALGHRPAAGRAFTPDETAAATSDRVMISYGLWERAFGRDPGVLGSTLHLDGTPHTVVGVIPPEPGLLSETDLWFPLTFGAEWYGSRAAHFLRPVGLLAEGTSVEEAQRALDVVSGRLESAWPETNEGWYAVAQPLQTALLGSTRPALLILLGAVALVLLIACANVANLLLARAVARRGEVAVRMALGASRVRIGRQLVTEGTVLALAAGAVGVGLALLGVQLLASLQPGDIPRIDEVAVDGTVLAFTLAVSVTVGIVFGLVPAAGRAAGHPSRDLGAAGRNRSGGSRRVRDLLVAGEVALSFVLLTGGILLARSFLELRRVDPGFQPEGVATVTLAFPEERYPGPREIGTALDGMLERVSSLPGVVAVGAASILPFSGMGGDTYIYAEDRPPARIRNIQNTAQYRLATEGYFRTLGIPVEQGRTFTREDAPGSAEGVVVNRTLADALFPDGDPVGQRVVIALDTLTAFPVIGVVSDSRQFGLGRPPSPEFHLSARQAGARNLQLVVRGRDGAAPPADELRRAVWEVDPRQTVPRVARMEDMVDGSLASSRFQASLVGLFAVLAVALAAVGIYGVLVQAVNDRRREIGVRMAMGAQGAALVRMVVGRGLRMGVLGVAVGALGAIAASRLLESLLFGVEPRDPATFAVTPVFLLGVVVLSAWLPARRATRTDPVEVLREEV